MIHVQTPDELSNWIHKADPGTKCVYYRGLLMRDREIAKNVLTPALITARKAWGLYDTGRITLVQKRMGDGDSLYMAEKIR